MRRRLRHDFPADTPSDGLQILYLLLDGTLLYRFTGPPDDGSYPGFCDLVFDQAGNIYGTTQGGGLYGWGTVFKLTPSSGGWVESVLYNFTAGADGGFPPPVAWFSIAQAASTVRPSSAGRQLWSGLRFDPRGSGWTEKVLYDFQAASDRRKSCCWVDFRSLWHLTVLPLGRFWWRRHGFRTDTLQRQLDIHGPL